MSDIVERLHERKRILTENPDALEGYDASAETEAIDEITRLRAENERLREIGRKASVALSLVMSLDFDDDADKWADARMKCDNAATSLRTALAETEGEG